MEMNHTSGNERRGLVPDLKQRGHAVNMPQTNGQIRFQNILFATDFSSTTQLALPYAIEMARSTNATIHVVHVVSPDIYPLVPPEEWARMGQAEEEFRNLKRQELEKVLMGIPHEFYFPAGEVWENLSRIIDEKNIDLLVLGTHGRTGIRKTVFGSVAERIFLQATCPVLTVGPRVSFRADHSTTVKLNCVLYATDFSPESLGAARFAIYLAREYHAQLVLLNAIQKSDAGQLNSAYETLRDVVPLGAGLAAVPKCTVERGAPADSILSVSMRDNADLIVLGIRSVEGNVTPATHFSRSVAYKVITQAECPVLTIRD
jgi:nucleotide-binding universal stress UspA family protein